MTKTRATNQETLLSSIIDTGLCTGCGACVALCPYMKTHNAQTVALFKCDREDGRCYRYCPRNETDLEKLQQKLFDASDITEELGALKGLYMTRASDDYIRKKAQHGGTVTALVALALDENLLDACVLADQDAKQLPISFTAKDSTQALKAAGSKFGNSPTVAEFNRVSSKSSQRLGVVATPCQAKALAKMKADPAKEDVGRIDNLKLVIGLFCGWTLDWRKLNRLVREIVGDQEILALDIPPSKHACMEVTTASGITEIGIEKVDECVRECCDYCDDMTAEFADISVGSARSPEGWDVDKGWNQVIVRSEKGLELLNLAREKNILEFKDPPAENLDKLKAVCAGKRKWAQKKLNELMEK